MSPTGLELRVRKTLGAFTLDGYLAVQLDGALGLVGAFGEPRARSGAADEASGDG